MHSTFLKSFIFISILFPLTSEAFIFYTWNLKHLGRERFSTKNVASVLADSDMVVIQEVNTGIEGRTKLREIRDAIKAIAGNENKNICMGISKKPSEGKERYAMLWNQDELVQTDEKANEIKCKENEFANLELTTKHSDEIVREPAYVLVKHKKSGRAILVATVHALPKTNGKTPEKEIPLIFESIDSEAVRIHHAQAKTEHNPLNMAIVAGDFNLSVRNKPFDKAKELGYLPVLTSGPNTSLKKNVRELSKPYDNVLLKVKGKKIHADARVINLYNQFKELEISTIYNNISDHCPIRVDINMNP
jgi:endonuclease/exonuclease/phosphatase family metal-dependent hydrolase